MKRNINIDGHSYSVASDDLYLKDMSEDFEPHMVELFKKLIDPNDIIADVGANIGLTSMLFSKLGKRVISFEPSPGTYKILTENIKNNNIHNVVPVNIGVGDENKASTITFASNNRSGGFVSEQTRPREGHTTENIVIKKLDDLWGEYEERLDFVKIDVEGFEGHVIRGGRDFEKT